MVRIVAFDAKEFNRTKPKKIQNPDNPEEIITVLSGFYSPLGCGIVTDTPDLLEEFFLKAFRELENSFGIDSGAPFLGSHEIKEHLNNDMAKTIAFSDQIVQRIQDYIQYVFFSYIILPPAKKPTVHVGGTRTPEKEVDTHKFLRDCTPAFSALSAWAFSERHDLSDTKVLIDSFRYKRMIAWDKLIEKTTPEIYPHGDECNPFIALADIIAFLTDVKLYRAGKEDMKYRRLTPDSIKSVWEGYSFETDVWFMDERTLGLFAWNSDELIDIDPYIKRPIVFFLADSIEEIDVSRDPDAPQKEEIPKERRFNRQLRNFPAFRAATKYAYKLGGSIQFYDRYQDSTRVRDGDVLIYMGHNSKRIAETFSDAYDVEVIKAKDVRKKV